MGCLFTIADVQSGGKSFAGVPFGCIAGFGRVNGCAAEFVGMDRFPNKRYNTYRIPRLVAGRDAARGMDGFAGDAGRFDDISVPGLCCKGKEDDGNG